MVRDAILIWIAKVICDVMILIINAQLNYEYGDPVLGTLTVHRTIIAPSHRTLVQGLVCIRTVAQTAGDALTTINVRPHIVIVRPVNVSRGKV